MPVEALLTIDPDKLFENHSIAEIQSIQSQLHNEIEKKREDLRTMVGLVNFLTFVVFLFLINILKLCVFLFLGKDIEIY